MITMSSSEEIKKSVEERRKAVEATKPLIKALREAAFRDTDHGDDNND